MKKKIIIPTIVCMLLALMAAPSGVMAADDIGQFNKLAETDFAYGDFMTREDFCVAVSKIFLGGSGKGGDLPFADTEEINPESVPYLYALYEMGVLKGIPDEDGVLFMLPESGIIRQEAITLLARALSISGATDYVLPFEDSDLVAPYAYGYIAWFAENGVVVGYPDGYLRPISDINAGELASLTMKTLDYNRRSNVTVTAVAGTGSRGLVNGAADDARFTLPGGVVCDKDGSVIVFDTYSNAIRVIKSGKVETLTGIASGTDDKGFLRGSYLDETLKKALLNRPAGGVYNSENDLVFADSANNVIRFIKDGSVYTFSGTTAGFKDGSRETAKFNSPTALAIDKNGDIYVADTLNNCIRKVDKEGKASTIAGKPDNEGFADGAASSAMFRAPSGIAVSADGKVIYVSDTGNHKIRKIENGQVSTVAGLTTETDDEGYPLGGFGDGVADTAMFNLPMGIILVDGVLFVADSGNNAIRAVTESGTVITVAGNGEPGDASGSGAEAVFSAPGGLCYRDGILYVADTLNNKIKAVHIDVDSFKH